MSAGHFSSARRRTPPVLLLAALLAATRFGAAATLTVNSTADTNGATCGPTCTLRQAINAANSAGGADTIAFNIAGTGLHTIALTSTLPQIFSPVTIDGYTQSGSAVNTASVGSNAVLKIAIDGSALPIGAASGPDGFVFANGSAPSNVRGLLIYGFRTSVDKSADGSAIVFSGASANSTVSGCFIGVDPNGQKANQGAGILVQPAASGVSIGGGTLADRNLLSGNLQGGVALFSGSNIVLGNLIGVAADGVSLFGNAGYGVALLAGTGNTIGGTTSSAANTIAGNALTGVLVAPASNGNKIEGNAIYGNAGLGIELSNSVGGAPDGVTPNDAGDGDGGANRSQNFPVLTGAGYIGSTLAVIGTLNSTPSRAFRIEFFANDQPDPSGFGEGQRYIGFKNTSTDASGNASFTVLAAPPGVARGQTLTATATDTVTGDTSEFSAGVIVVSGTTVTNTNDSGAGSLRDAIINANANAGADTIDFAIPGPGVHVIQLQTALPTITDTVTIDGYTQPGAAPNALDVGDDAVIAVRLDGSQLSGSVSGLAICGSNTTVRGLAITGFAAANLAIDVGQDAGDVDCPGVAGVVIEGNFIGLQPDGSTIAANHSGVTLFGIANAQVGGNAPAQRNLISGNNIVGLDIVGGSGTSVDGNYVGTDASGLAARGNGSFGIEVSTNASGVSIGTQAPNRIAYNGQTGIVMRSGSSRLAANDIHDNGGLGIDLCASIANCPDGVTPNDSNDADQGANNLQNFPVITALSRNDAGLFISGSLDRPATATSLTFAIGVYANTSCDPSGFGEGERYFGSFNFVSGSAGAETFTNVAFPTTASLPPGTKIMLTATDPAGNTSEFSHCEELDSGAQTFVVNSTADMDDGNCTAAPDGCTLREAINAANARAGADLITFAIPGAGVHVIAPATSLPTVVDTVTIDGYTQPGATPNTLVEGDDAAIRVRIDGSAAPVGTFAFAICGDNVVVRGLSLTGFHSIALAIGENNFASLCPGTVSGAVVRGNFIGLAPDGSAAGNNIGVRVNRVTATVGGSAPADRNVISANALQGVEFTGAGVAGSSVLGNYIGTAPSGTSTGGMQAVGVQMSSLAATGSSSAAIRPTGSPSTAAAFSSTPVRERTSCTPTSSCRTPSSPST